MKEKSLARTGRAEIDKFVGDKSVLDLVDSILYLDTIKPYVELSQNGEIGEFLQKRNIPVVYSKADFDYLYDSLTDRIEKLAGKDERVKTYLQRAEYQKQITELPNLISKLEKTASVGFDELKAPFRAAMEYVYDGVINNGFIMNMDEIHVLFKKIKITRINNNNKEIEFEVTKKGKDKAVYLNINNQRTITRLYLIKKKSDNLLLTPLLNEEEGGENFRWFYNSFIFSPEEMVEYFKDFIIQSTDKESKEVMSSLRVLLSLPTIMNNYLKKKTSDLESSLKELTKKKSSD